MYSPDLINYKIPHSCYPNSGYNFNNELIAIREIVPSEPVTIDFSTLFMGFEPGFICHCGHIGCRGVIRGFDQLPVIIQEKYLDSGVVPGFILRGFR